MKPIIRYQSQLLFRRSYKPVRVQCFRPAPKVIFSLRPTRPKVEETVVRA